MIFDTHAHYDYDVFNQDREILLQNFPQNGILGVVNVGINIPSSIESIKLAKKYYYIYSAIGIHPLNIQDENFNENYISDLKNLLENNDKIVAIGEIGLDYHLKPNEIEKNSQKEIFENHIKLAVNNDLPILVHSRDSHNDIINLLKKYKPKGIVHCFSGSTEIAKEVVKLGMYIGIGGVVTFKNAKNIVSVVKEIPLENLVLETDAPYLAPHPHRGERCDSNHIKLVAEKISEIKNIDISKVYKQTFKNAINLFKIQN